MPQPSAPGRVASSAILNFIDAPALEAALEPVVPDRGDRQFLVRCVTGEGPAHHRGANYVLLTLLARALAAAGAPVGHSSEDLPVPMHLPPHLRTDAEEQDYPLGLPRRPLERLARAPRDVEAMADCLTDGPPQHAVANVMMAAMLGALLDRLEQK